MANESNHIIPHGENIPPNIQSIPNMRVDKDKLERPYAKIENENGDYFKQTKLKSGKTKREMVTDE